jgi:hypothetical protein
MAIAAGGCGDEQPKPTGPQRVSAASERIVAQARSTLYLYCRQVGRYLTRRGSPPTAAEAQQVDGELDRLIAVAQENPDAQLRTQVTLRELLGDMLEDLEGSTCSGAFEQKLGQGLASLPSG